MNHIPILSLFFAVATSLSADENRTWTNADGTKHFEAQFVTRLGDEITLLLDDGKQISIALEKLHEDDNRWLKLNHPIDGKDTAEAMPDAEAVFDTLVFGDDRETVSQKLKESKIVESSVEGTFQGRTGLNGIYRTKHKIGGLYCYLFFDWSQTGKLTEITLQTEDKSADEYISVLKPCWEQCIPLITAIHGKPRQKGNISDADSLEDGQMLASCVWKIETGGSILLGTARQGLGYQTVVRFTRETL